MLTDEQIDAVWDEWHGRRGFQATPKEARREFARAVLAAAQPDVVEALLDAEALRLAVTHEIDLEMGLCYCEASWVDMTMSETHEFMQDWGAGDVPLRTRMEHVRRAIARAARTALGEKHE